MEIEQKKFSTKHTFTFQDQFLNFAVVKRSGSFDIDVPYGNIPKKCSIQLEENTQVRNAGYIWCVLGTVGSLVFNGSWAVWLLIGLGCLLWVYLTRINYTVFETDRGSIWVMHDSQHAQILNELSTRRKRQLRELLGEINVDNDLQNEISKYVWLAEQEVISKEEADSKIAQVQLLHRQSTEDADDDLLN